MSDNLSALFSSQFSVTKDENTTDGQHPRLCEFKERPINAGSQSKRRKDYLERQKSKRYDARNYARKLAEGDLDEDDANEIGMEISAEKDEKAKEKKSKVFRPYRNQLMLSEWVVDPPTDLVNDWTMVVCPTGKRVLVVAHKGQTSMYAKNGFMLKKFPSLLPGGHRANQIQGFHSTILDCVYDEANGCLFVLDMMCFRGYPLYDCETSFRFFWIQTKLFNESENDIQNISRYNKFKFIPCPSVKCEEASIIDMVTAMHEFQVDGLLFYHNQCHYTPGRTPLVGWLKPFMLPEILNIQLPSSYLDSDQNIDFNRTILKAANEDLQKTSSDRSIYKSKLNSSITSNESKNESNMET
eukprot:TCONS_00022170-protein